MQVGGQEASNYLILFLLFMIMMMISRIQSISALSLFSFSNSSMYPSSSASSSSSSQPHNSSISQTGLTRYGSAPGSLLTSTVDAIIAGGGGGGGSRIPPPGHYFSGECKDHHRSSSSYEAFDGSALVRQKSSPAGFLAHLADHNHNGMYEHHHRLLIWFPVK